MECEKCSKTFRSKAGKSNHVKHCDGSGTSLDKKKSSAEWKCPICERHIHSRRERHVELCDGLGAGASKRRKGPGKSWSKGMRLSLAHREKIRRTLTGSKWSCNNPGARSRKISDALKGNPRAGGYRRGSGRSRGRWYESDVAGSVYLDSSYEVRLAVYLDSRKISWTRNTEKFVYCAEDAVMRSYTPDFFLPDLDMWIETKGFATARDRCKWRDFPHRLYILFECDIVDLEIGRKTLEGIRLDEDAVLKTVGV